MPFNSISARRASHLSWANTVDPRARTAAARAAQAAKREQEVDPDGVMSPAERRVAVEHKRRAHMLAMNQKSVAKRAQERADREAGE